MAMWKRMGLMVAVLAVSWTSASSQARADLFLAGSGTNATGNTVSGSVNFNVTGNILTVTLSNTTAGGTLLRGDIMTGLSYNYVGANPTLALLSIALTNPGSSTADDRIFTSKTASNTNGALSGSWTNALGSSPIGELGVAASGYNGAFSAGGITRGSGGEDYGIVSSGTFPNANASNSFNNSAFPLIQHSLTFTFSGATGFNLANVRDVNLLFGTAGTGTIRAVPEPSSLALLAAAGGVLGTTAIRRRRKAKAVAQA